MRFLGGLGSSERVEHARGASGRTTTIRNQILLAFVAMSIITASLGYFSVRDLQREGDLVDRTFDQSLMSINFARAAAADFNAVQAAAVRRELRNDAASKARIDAAIADLLGTMDDDLSVAVERAQSDRVLVVAQDIRKVIQDWKIAWANITSGSNTSVFWDVLDKQAQIVDQKLDLLVNYTAGDGFTYRQTAHATVLNDRRFNIAVTFLAIVLSGTIAWLLARRVLQPIKKASDIARQIADGDLEVVVTTDHNDELGALLAAMEIMRQNIKASMEREVSLRRSAQTRLADALESSLEGIVVVDADGKIALANTQASQMLDTAENPLSAGDLAARLDECVARMTGREKSAGVSNGELEIADGRWLRISQSRTREGGHIFVYSDISLVKAQQAALKTANMWLDAALANLSQGLCLFDAHNQLKVYNHRFCELFGLPPERVRFGMTLAELVELGFNSGLQLQAKELSNVPHRPSAAANHLIRSNRGRAIAASHRPLEEKSWLATYEDVTDRLDAAEKITYMARHDTLTGLPNRAVFAERIEGALAGVRCGDRFALLCLDLDHFKEVNDTLGHPIGDELLRAVARRLRETTRENDMVARLGGDEFAIVQTNVDKEEDAQLLARRIIEALSIPFIIEGHPVVIGVSIGISMSPADGQSYDELLKNADMALYRAKADGRNGWHFFEKAMNERQQARRMVELDLRDALVGEQFELHYQPIVDVRSRRITGFEALIRWRHPLRGLVQPAEFIPIAEEMGLISQIGAWVLKHACHDAATWPEDVTVAVNMSAAQLRNSGTHEAVVGALRQSGLDPRRLVLEITESVLIANPQTALVALDQFKAMGIHIAMDDFGTGYSSLSYLRNFPFDKVKIDKSFIQESATHESAASIVRAIIALCSSLGMGTVAEGIETAGQLAVLEAEGCREAQGFFFGKPVPSASVMDLIGMDVSDVKAA